MLTLPPLNRRHKAGLFLVLVAIGLSLFFEASAKQTAGILLLGSAATWFLGSVRPRTLGLIILASTASCAGLYLMLPVWGEREFFYVQAAEYDQALLGVREAVAEAFVVANGDEIRFQSPTTGAIRLVPREHWDEALKRGYKPTTHSVMYSPDGQRGMVPNAERAAKLRAGFTDQPTVPPPDTLPPDFFDQRRRTVRIPEIAHKWQRRTPEAPEWVAIEEFFPADMSDQDIIREFQTRILLPRPAFSFRAAIRSHLLSSVVGSLLFLLGLLGWMLFVRRALRRERPENATQSA